MKTLHSAPPSLLPTIADSAGIPAAVTGSKHRRNRLVLLCLASLGIVYGDIGTSPLYAMRECFYG
ncbi:MAG TPA: KUP/HAK/KT family potassium transporter, partial [Candidatus Udaeobacter sp.]